MFGNQGVKRIWAIMLGGGYVDFPEDVVFEILLRLPVTSLGRFKCVCKHWYNVIESREFRKRHFALQKNSAFLMLRRDFGTAPNVEWKIFSGKRLTVVENLNVPVWSFFSIGPCRGLFLVCRRQFGGADLHLLNPATKAFRLLPTIPGMPNDTPDSEDSAAYGLGWEPSTDDYKVVCFLYRRQVAMVYTLSSDSWRLLDSPPPLKLGTIGSLSNLCQWNIFANGFCYWLPIFTDHRSLVSFDVAREIFEMVTLPPDMINVWAIALSTYYDSLALLTWKSGVIEVWVFQQQHCWTKVFNIKHMCPDIRAAGIWNNTHVLLKKGRPEGPVEDILAYDMNNNHEEKVTGDCIMSSLNYKRSLFPVKGGSKDLTASQSSSHILHFRQT